MKKILLALLIASNCLAVTQDTIWLVPHGSTLPSWNYITSNNFLQSGAITFPSAIQLGGASNVVLLNYGSNGNTLGVRYQGFSGTVFPAVVSANPSTNGLMIVRGGGQTNTTNINPLSGGEGFAWSANSSGLQTLSFSTSFQDTPACTCSTTGSNHACNVLVVSSSSVQFGTTSASEDYFFICIGQRNSSD